MIARPSKPRRGEELKGATTILARGDELTAPVKPNFVYLPASHLFIYRLGFIELYGSAACPFAGDT